jgi:hypothetical protein
MALSWSWETAPTRWVRPVGEVVVAQPASRVSVAAVARRWRFFRQGP